MVSLARASLRYEAKRFLPAALAVAFSGLLMLVQLGLLLGMFGTVSTVIDYAKADLWVGFAATPSFDLGRPIAVRHESSLRMNPEVVTVEPATVPLSRLAFPSSSSLKTETKAGAWLAT